MNPNPETNNGKNGYSKVFDKEQEEKISSLEKLLHARKNLLEDIERHDSDAINPDEEDDNDGLKDYRGIF